MKRTLIAAAAALSFLAPLGVATTAAADPPRHHDRGYDRGYERGYDRHDRDYDNRDDRRDERRAYREGYREGRWDNRYNGYYRGDRWYYGPPPGHVSDYRPGYRNWRRGDRLPDYYRSRYVVVDDYRRHHLRAPPRGYHYVRDDRGEYLLVGIATGVILGAILAN